MIQCNKIQIAYILGAGHCGSTLLNLLLNGHSKMVGVSEISKLGSLVGAEAKDPTFPLTMAPWQTIARCYERRSGQSFSAIQLHHPGWSVMRHWRQDQIDEWGRPYVQLTECILECSGASILVDASKAWQQLYLLQAIPCLEVKVVHLIRDGRAIVNSYLRKYGSFWSGYKKWTIQSTASILLRHRLEVEWLQVRYETLAAQPEATLKQLCEFLGVEYESQMLAFRDHHSIGIGGNRMARGSETTIRLDERWRDEMQRRDRLKFAVLGSCLNKYLGY